MEYLQFRSSRSSVWLCFVAQIISYVGTMVQHTLHSPIFEVFRTPNMGLGLRSLLAISFADMALEVHGFVEFISDEEEARTNIFHSLITEDHPSLFWSATDDALISSGILFGPLSLCNSNEFVDGILNPYIIQFVNYLNNGREYRWCLKYDWGIQRIIEYEGTVDEMEIQFPYHLVDFVPVQGEDPFHIDVDYSMATPGFSWDMVSEYTADSFPYRVMMDAPNPVYRQNFEDDVGVEIMVAYDVVVV